MNKKLLILLFANIAALLGWMIFQSRNSIQPSTTQISIDQKQDKKVEDYMITKENIETLRSKMMEMVKGQYHIRYPYIAKQW